MFARLDFPRFLVCCSRDLSDDESEEKPSVAICGGSICILTGLFDWPLAALTAAASVGPVVWAISSMAIVSPFQAWQESRTVVKHLPRTCSYPVSRCEFT